MRVISNRRGARLSGLLLLILFLVILLGVTGWFAARTEGVRSLLADKLTDRLGTKVLVGESRIGWPYALVLRHVHTPDFEAGSTPGFSVGEVRLGRHLSGWQLTLRHVDVTVKPDGAAGWEPQVATRLADIQQPSALDLVRLTKGNSALRLRVIDGSFRWLDTDGNVSATLRNVQFRMEPVRLPEREMTYYRLRIYAGTGGAFGNPRDLHWEWLTAHDLDYVEINRTAQYDNNVEAGGGPRERVVEPQTEGKASHAE